MPVLLYSFLQRQAQNATIPAAPQLTPAELAADRAPSILTSLGVIGCLALVVTCMRLWVRQYMLKYVGSDDIVMAAAMLCGVGIYVCFCLEAKYGLGRHGAVLTPDMMSHFGHITFFHNLLILAGICLAKVSICLLLIRLVKHRGYAWFLWFLLAFISAYHIACEFTIIFACIPTKAQWDLAARKGAKCFSLQVFTDLGLANSIVNMITDVLLALLPIPVIMAMQLNNRTKIALVFIMMLGFVAVGAGGVKLKAQIDFLKDTDKTFEDKFPVWAAVELYCAVLAASLPTLRPLFLKVIKTARSSFSDSAARRSARRNAKMTDDKDNYGYAKSPGTFYSECSTSAATPDPGSKEIGSYFSFLKKSPSPDDLRSRGASISLTTMPPSANRPAANMPPRGQSPDSDSTDDTRGAYIMRTTKVSTSSETAHGKVVPSSTFTAASWPSDNDQSRLSSGRKASVTGNRTWVDAGAGVASPSPAYLRQTLQGQLAPPTALHSTRESLEDLPSPGPREGSVENLVGNAR
ncbi:hypothetical protein ANO11243_034070 [Dothideomycetidae sp. 11243]|nr:hypothetical protein ANO11243_034070 [fungal sp. No.11243]